MSAQRLCSAIENGETLEMIRSILDANANPNGDAVFNIPIECAAATNRHDVIVELFERGAGEIECCCDLLGHDLNEKTALALFSGAQILAKIQLARFAINRGMFETAASMIKGDRLPTIVLPTDLMPWRPSWVRFFNDARRYRITIIVLCMYRKCIPTDIAYMLLSLVG